MLRYTKWMTILICLASGFHVMMFLALTLNNSLWVDEIHSLSTYVLKGSLEVVTTYFEPNNHIFFNLLQSIAPWIQDYDPARARLLTTVFTFSGMVLLCGWMFRKGDLLSGAIILACISVNNQILAFFLQARGYGLQFLLSVIMLLELYKWDKTGRARDLAVIMGCAILAIWTTPAYIILWAPLLTGVLYLYKERRNQIIQQSLFAILIGLVLYLPVERDWKNWTGCVTQIK